MTLSSSTTHNRAVFLTGTTADYCDFISTAEMRQQWIEEVFARLRELGVETLTLANLPGDSSSVTPIVELAPRYGYYAFLRPAYSCPRVTLGAAEERESLKRAVTNKQMFRRKMSAINKIAPAHVRHDQSWSDIEPALPAFARAQVGRSLALGRISNLTAFERRKFLHELGKRLSCSGWMTMSRLFIGNHPAAWNYGFQFCKSWFWYQPTFDTKYEQLSPGFCLLTHVVQAACDSPQMDTVDLGLGNEGYKSRFSTSARSTLHLTLSSSLSRHISAIARQRSAQATKTVPAIEQGIRNLLSRASRVRRRQASESMGAFAGYLAKRAWKQLFGDDEILFYEWLTRTHAAGPTPTGLHLLPLTVDIAADAAIFYAGDAPTTAYLLRCARRLQRGRNNGFVLIATDAVPVHFSWVTGFDKFEVAELGRSLAAPTSNAAMLFDCWTPSQYRGKNYFSLAIDALAQQVYSTGRTPWIFAAKTNRASIRGIEKTGFDYRYSLTHRRLFGIGWVDGPRIVSRGPER